MENDSISSSSSESKLPLIVGIVGFALGAAGLVLGLKAKSAADAASAAATAAQTATTQVQADLQSKAPATEVTALGAEINNLKTAIAADNQKVTESIKQIQDIVSKKSAPAPGPKDGTAPKNGQIAGAGEYIVVSGDNFGSIARKVGVSAKKLQELNPTVNPNRMQIGTKLKTK